MASGVLPKPGEKYGPCEEVCEHRDCAKTREMAGSPCPICREAIGFGVEFYCINDELHHEQCVYEQGW